MKTSRSRKALPLAVERALRKLGADLSLARRRRRLPAALMAERALVSRDTLRRVERGDPSVSMAVYATVLFVLGLDARIGALADPASDSVGLTLEGDRVPKRIRLARGGTKGGESGP